MWSFVIFLTFTCGQFVSSGYIYDMGLGTECLYDEDCITRNSFCKGNKICSCKIGYQYDPGSDVCFPKEIDLKCNEDYDCSAIDNAKCVYGKCQCRPNYVASKDRSSCLPTMKLTPICLEDSQCNSVMNKSYCDHMMKRCICERGYKQDSYRMLCVEKKKLHSRCMTNADCEDEENVGKVECKGTGLILSCECAEGYVERNDMCYKDGSSQAVLSTSLIFAVFLLQFLNSFFNISFSFK